MYSLFLDDERMPSDVTWIDLPDTTWQVVRSLEEFQRVIKTQGLPALVSFDHDLGQAQEGTPLPTGFDCAKWLVDHCLDHEKCLPMYVVHSKNPVGCENIYGLFHSFEKFQKTHSTHSP